MIELDISETGNSAWFTRFPSMLRGEWEDHFISDNLCVASRGTPVCAIRRDDLTIHLMPGDCLSDEVSGFHINPVGYIMATIYYATIKNERFRITQEGEENE